MSINPTDQQLADTLQQIEEQYKTLSQITIQPGEGYLKYPYLIPAGFYKQMWDWDGFFMGNYFASIGKPEYLRYWALNLIQGIDEEGYVAGCATTDGPRPIFGHFSMKPFLSQGVYFAASKMGEFGWVEEIYDALKLAISYREKIQQDEKTGVFFWQNAMQSGADNNVAINYFIEDTRSYLACDASTFQYKEYRAQAAIASKLGKSQDAALYTQKAEELKAAINKYLWCEEDSIYYSVDRETGDFYKHVSYSSFVTLMEDIATQDMGKRMIEKYLITPEHMKGKYGLRTLSGSSVEYNNKNIIVPFSNWQGPVWPIANYIYSIGLKNYDFEAENRWVAYTMGTLMLEDIEKYEIMHESYHADTGAPLAPGDDYVDENGKFVGFVSWNLCVYNMLAGVVRDEWMLLDIEPV